MSLLLLLVPAILTALLDLVVSGEIRLLGAHPSLSVALIAAWAVLRRREEAMVLAPATGLLLGLLGNEPLGASIIALAPVVLLASLRNPEVTEGRFMATVWVALLGAMTYVLIVTVVVAAAGRVVPAAVVVGRQMVATAVLTAPLTAVVYLLLVRAAWQPHVRGEFRRY